VKRIRIYTDGGCDKNPGGVGAWAVRLLDGDQAVERSGSAEKTTNNRMELTAAIRALELLKDHLPSGQAAEVEVLTDSQYLAFGMNEWIIKWQLHNWRLKDGSPVKNADLWKHLLEMNNSAGCRLKWVWVQGHAGDPNNLRVDRLVQEAIEKQRRAALAPASEVQADQLQPPQVKLLKRDKMPIGVNLFRKSSPDRFQVSWEHLQKLIEDLLRVQREGEEGKAS